MKRLLALTLSLALSLSLAAPAAASEAMGGDVYASDTLLNQDSVLSTGLFWSEPYSDLRTEYLVTYRPNASVTPIVCGGDAVTDRSTVSAAAKRLEDQGYRVVAGLNGDFFNVNTGLPIGILVTEGRLRCSDAGYYAIGFRPDGSAVLGRPAVRTTADLGYWDGSGQSVVRTVSGINKARVSTGGIYLYTYDFNSAHTTGNTEAGVDVVCTVAGGRLSIGESAVCVVDQVVEAQAATPIGPDQVVLSVNLKSGDPAVEALRNVPVGGTVTLTLASASEDWDDVEYAVGALYSLVENGAVASGLEAGSAPRTAVGQKDDGSLVFYAMDGRRSGHSIGATMEQVARRLIELGCVTALGLDGGGSTAFTVTQPDELAAKTINRPSGGAERAVTDQIFLVASNEPTGELGHFYVSADHPYVLAGSRASISASAVDTNFIPMEERYELEAGGGELDGNVLTTPREGGDITVTASHRDGEGSTVVHAIETPDAVAVRDGQDAIVTHLTAAPGASVPLHGSAAWRHLPLQADPEAFTWSAEGDMGTIDESGVFTAAAPGEGTITVTAGGRSTTIPVTVAENRPQAVEDFEGGTTIFRGSGERAGFSLNRNGDFVRMGRASGKLEYDLTEGAARWNATAQPAVIQAPGLNLWVYGDGSGNGLSLLYSAGGEEIQVLPLTALDFTGWKQVSVFNLPAPAAIRGLEVSGTGKGAVYLDHITASFDGTVDNEPPQITAELNQEDWTVTGTVSDAADGLLPASAVTIRFNGGAMTGEYDPASGSFTAALPSPGEAHEAMRVTVTARDASGNIGRASVDVEPYGVDHKFTDIEGYWAAPYVDFLYNSGVTTGYDDGTFRPDQTITRAQFSVMLYRYLGLDGTQYAEAALPFADLGSIPEYALPAVRALYAGGVVNGTAGKDGTVRFNPQGSLTRAQAAAMIGRTQEKGYAAAELSFTDAGRIPGYAEFYIRTMAAQGVLSGYSDGSFKPNARITRGQMAKILYNLM